MLPWFGTLVDVSDKAGRRRLVNEPTPRIEDRWPRDSARIRSLVLVLHGGQARRWDEPEQHPVHDAKWALTQLRDQHRGAPIALLGHSMGGRAALRVG